MRHETKLKNGCFSHFFAIHSIEFGNFCTKPSLWSPKNHVIVFYGKFQKWSFLAKKGLFLKFSPKSENVIIFRLQRLFNSILLRKMLYSIISGLRALGLRSSSGALDCRSCWARSSPVVELFYEEWLHVHVS